MMKFLISMILCIALCLSFSVFSYAEENDLSAFETVGETVFFGHYEQDNDLSNGKEPIEWIVLDVQDGKSLLLSKYVLDAQPYDYSASTNVWKDCTLRKWLNNEFVKEAFPDTLRKILVLSEIDNGKGQDYSFWSSGGSENTFDTVFVFSYAECMYYYDLYNQILDEEILPTYIVAIATPYACITGEDQNPYLIWSGNICTWWLRSPSPTSGYGMYSSTKPSFSFPTNRVQGVRPAVWIDLNELKTQLKANASSTDDYFLSDSFVWGQEYTQGELTYSFVQEGTLSYYSLRGNDSDTLVNAVTSNAIPGTEKINQKIQEIMQACNYEATEGELDGVRTELYGSQESDAYVMATYGDWGVNMMLFVDGTTGIADYFSGTISTEDDAKPSSNGSLFGSAMQEANQYSSTTKQFNLTAKEYIDAFNKQYGNMGMTLVPDSSRDDCHLAIRGEPTDIRIQFCDKINGPWTTGSGLDMKEWNWLYAYIATDDYSVDVDYFASFPMMCSFFAAIVGCDYTQEEFMDNCNASGPNGYPILTYTKNGIKNEIQFRDASVGNYHQTVYSASVELVQ